MAVIVPARPPHAAHDLLLGDNHLQNAPDRAAVDTALDALEASIPGVRLTR